MSNNVDQRVVQMDFDNAKFERGVKTTLESLTRLKDKLDSTSGKSLSKMTDTPVEFRGIEAGIEKLNAKFSTMGLVWQQVVRRATDAAINKFGGAIQQIKSGGAQRAANIDQATFMLKGLIGNGKKADKMLEKVKKNAMDAVDGTAYGFDSAAKAAAQFYASGMKGGKQMEGALRGVAGVAAMTGSSYDDIAQIFTTVAGQGKVTAEQWNQLASRGINGAAAMAKQMGISEKKVREMTSKGEISFKMFAKAMDNAFGEHAKKANETFEGSLANMKAALSRVGAEFFTPYRAHMIKVFNSITPLINSLKKSLSPVALLFDKTFGALTTFASTKLQALNVGFESFGKKMQVVTQLFKADTFLGGKNPFTLLIEGFSNVKNAVAPFIDAITGAFESIFGLGSKMQNYFVKPFALTAEQMKKFKKGLKKDGITGISNDEINKGHSIAQALYGIVVRFHEFTKSIKTNDGVIRNFKDTFGGIFAVFDIFGRLISSIIGALLPGRKAASGFIESMLSFTGTIGRALITLDKFLQAIGFFDIVGNSIKTVITVISTVLGKLFHIIANLTTIVSTFVHDHLATAISAISVITGKIKFGLLFAFRSAKSIIKDFGESFKEAITGGIIGKIKSFIDKIKLMAAIWRVNFVIAHGGKTVFDVIREKLEATKLGSALLKFVDKLRLFAAVWRVNFVMTHGGKSLLDTIHDKIDAIKNDGLVKTLQKLIDKIKLTASIWKTNFAIQNGGRTFFEVVLDKIKAFARALDNFTYGILTKFKTKLFDVGNALKTGIIDKVKDLRKEGISGVVEKLKSLTFTDVAHGISKGAHGIANAFITLKDSLSDFYNNNLSDKLDPVKEFFVEFFKALGKSFKNVNGKIVSEIGDAIAKFFDGIKDIASGGNEKIASMLGDFGGAVKSFCDAIANSNTKDALKGLASAFIIFDRINDMKKKSKTATASVTSFGKLMGTLNSTIASYKKTKMSKSSAFKEIAKGILMLAGALYIIAAIDTGKLKVAVGVMGVMVAAVAGLVKFLESDGQHLNKDLSKFAMALGNAEEYKTITDQATKLEAMAKMITRLAIAFGILSLAFVKMGDTKDLLKSVVGMIIVTVALGALIGVCNELSQSSNEVDPKAFKTLTFAMGGIGAAVMSMGKAMQLIGSIKTEDFGKAIGGMIAVVGMMALFIVAINQGGGDGGYLKAAVGMFVLAEAVTVMAVAARLMSGVPVGAIIAVGLAMAALVGICWIIGKISSKLDKASGFIVAMAKALVLVGIACLIFNNVSTEGMIKAGIALVVLLGLLSGFGALVSKFPAIAAGLAQVTATILLVSGALLIMAIAIRALSGISWDEMKGGLLTLAVTLGILAAACAAFTVGIIGAVALLAVAAAIGILAVSLGLIAAIPSSTIVTNLEGITMALAKFIAIIGIVGRVAGPGLALIGIGLALAGVGVVALAYGLTNLIPILAAFALMPKSIIDGGLNVLLQIFGTLAKIVVEVGLALLVFAAGAALAGLGAKLLGAGLKQAALGLALVAGALILLAVGIAAVSISIMLFAAAISGAGSQIVSTVRGIAATILSVIFNAIEFLLSKIPIVGDSLAEKFSGWGDGIVDAVAGDKTKEAGSKAVEKTAEGVNENKGKVDDALANVVDGEKAKAKAEDTGKGIGDGVGGGIMESLGNFSGNIDLNSSLGDIEGDAKKTGDTSGANLTNGFMDKMNSLGGDIDINSAFGDIEGDAKKTGDTSGLGFNTSFLDSAGKGGKGVDVSKILGNTSKKSKSEGNKSGKEFPKGYNQGVKNGKVDASALPKKASKSIAKDKSIKNAADSNVKTYNSTLSKAKGADKAGESLGKKSAKGAKTVKEHKSAGKDNADGFASGVASPSALKAAYDAGYKLGKESVKGEKAATKSHSPSKVFIELGKFLSQGLAIGIQKFSSLAYNAAYDMGSDVHDATKDALGHIADVVSDDFDFDPTIRPVVDMSDVTASASAINGMMNSSFGLNVPARGINIAGNIAANLQNGGDSALRSTVSKLASKLDGVTNSMNSREMITNITIDGAGQDAELLANTLVDKIQLRMRSV